MKNKYDSSVVFLYSIGKEDLLPQAFRKQIPYSTISTWRKSNYKNYLGHEYRYYFDQAFSSADLNLRYLQLKKSMRSLARSWVTLSHILLPIIKKSCNETVNQRKLLDAINTLKHHFGLNSALKMMGLSKNLFNQWTLEARFECFDSYTQLCVKRHPQQLEFKEINKIKALLTDPETDHWPIVSIAGNALRKKQVVASLYSWYKYAKLWGIHKKLIKKQRKTVGLIATCPNEYLHVDTTFYTLINDRKVCISFVMDNYSKMILGYHVSSSNNFELVISSMTKAIKTILLHPDQNHSFMVTDGGKENHNSHVDAFISRLSNHKITKIRALKDIRFSNSPVEAVHRTMKGRYLKNRKFESIKSLNEYLKWAVNDYNRVRPHYKHRPRTPEEVYFNTPLGFDIRKRVKGAIKARVKNNSCANCMQCSGSCKAKTTIKKPKT